ncbi:MAG: hypothetical protein ACI8WB_005083 [Phenylobacterium sp.]|jgi:hypothetical protein
MMSDKSFVLYSTDGCHLCEQVVEMLVDISKTDRVQTVDIVDDDTLVEAYGIRIPVVKNSLTGAELGWPFDHQQLNDFVVLN